MVFQYSNCIIIYYIKNEFEILHVFINIYNFHYILLYININFFIYIYNFYSL